MEGLTIAFICSGSNHPTVENYHLFGSQFWDDCKSNKSKKGYYFAYYVQKKFVRIHQIVELYSPDEKPDVMRNWMTTRQIVGLSPPLKQLTWNEWIHGIGKGSPYATDYHSTHTGTWSLQELHANFPTFDFDRFKSEVQPLGPEEKQQVEENQEVEDTEDIDQDVELLKQVNQRVVRNTLEGIHRLRQEFVSLHEKRIEDILTSIKLLNEQLDTLQQEKIEILQGSMDTLIVERETETKMNQFIMDYL